VSGTLLLVVLGERGSLQNIVDTPDQLFARILNAAACIKRREGQLRRKTRDIPTPVAKCTEVDGGIFEKLFELLQICHFRITSLSFKFRIKIRSKLTVIIHSFITPTNAQ